MNERASAARKIVLCADDYAMNAGVSRGILDLVDAGRLSAVSVMVTTAGWREHAVEIRARRNCVAVGLHLDLTWMPWGGTLRAPSLGALIAASLSRRLDVVDLATEFERQFDVFEAEIGFAPDHVDGHQHVHVLPCVRDALLAVICRRYGDLPIRRRPLVRNPSDALRNILRRRSSAKKALVVAGLGANFSERLSQAGFPTNKGFSGFSAFRRETPFDSELAEFLLSPGDRHLVMCHPGHADAASDPPDAQSARRGDEYEALSTRSDIRDWLLRVDRAGDDSSSAYADWLHT